MTWTVSRVSRWTHLTFLIPPNCLERLFWFFDSEDQKVANFRAIKEAGREQSCDRARLCCRHSSCLLLMLSLLRFCFTIEEEIHLQRITYELEVTTDRQRVQYLMSRAICKKEKSKRVIKRYRSLHNTVHQVKCANCLLVFSLQVKVMSPLWLETPTPMKQPMSPETTLFPPILPTTAQQASFSSLLSVLFTPIFWQCL